MGIRNFIFDIDVSGIEERISKDIEELSMLLPAFEKEDLRWQLAI